MITLPLRVQKIWPKTSKKFAEINKAGSFLAYYYRVVNTGEQKTEIKAKISAPLLVSIKNDLERQNRLDVITRGDIEKDGYHQKMELAGSQFSLKSWYVLSLVNEEYIYMMDIVEDSKNESAKIKGSASGSIGDSQLEEYTVLIKNKLLK